MIEIYLDLDELLQAFKYTEQELILMSKEYTYDVAIEILRVAKQLVPVDTGRLRDSGKVVQGVNGWSVLFDCPYALYVHENMIARHPNGGVAKFLDLAVLRVTGSFGR